MATKELDGILNYLPVSEVIGTAGQPAPGQFAAISAAGYEVVVNLAMPDSPNALPNECELVEALSLEYVHIPVVWEMPEFADLDRFMDTMERYRDRKVFVHCALNMRVSVFVFLYRVIRQRLAVGSARQPLLRIWQPDAVWTTFTNASLARHGHEPAGLELKPG